MSILARNIVLAIAMTLEALLNLYWWILLIAVLITWISPDPRNPIVRFLRNVTEPVLYQVRRTLPFVVVGGLDLSPIVVFLGIEVVNRVVVDTLRQVAFQMASAGIGWLTGA